MKDVLEKLVTMEAKKLKSIATKDELNLLDFDRLDPECRSSCIYGQMTGNCNSSRAIDLIKKSCTQVYTKGPDAINTFNGVKLNGKPNNSRVGHNIAYFSPIEIFIYKHENREQNNKILIEFLKGETKTLNFK